MSVLLSVCHVPILYRKRPGLTSYFLSTYGSPIILHCVSKKHVTTFSTISSIELELSVYSNFWHNYYEQYRPATCFFIFPPHLFRALTLPWEIVETQMLLKIKQNHENFTGRWDTVVGGHCPEHKFHKEIVFHGGNNRLLV